MSAIEWTDETWNPTAGCSPVSPGCANCYAMFMARRLEAMGQEKYAGLTHLANGHAAWTGAVRFDADTLDKPLHWAKPRRVFVNSMSDLFHDGFADEEIDQVFAVMALSPRHTFQVLTKRAERMVRYFADPSGTRYRRDRVSETCGDSFGWSDWHRDPVPTWPLPNVWLGVSVEDQRRADERIPFLLRTPAAVRFLSMEPLLGPVNLPWLQLVRRGGMWHPADAWTEHKGPPEPAIHWVILGGESGPSARPCDVRWLESIAAQCQAAGVPVFVKQLGSVPVMGEDDWRAESCAPRLNARNNRHAPQGSGLVPLLLTKKGGQIEEFPRALQVREFPEVARA